MFKNGGWIKWDGSDVKELIVTETITLAKLKEDFPEKYNSLIKKENGREDGK